MMNRKQSLDGMTARLPRTALIQGGPRTVESGYTNRAVATGIVAFVLIVGLGYLWLQWERLGSIQDALFVSLLVGDSALLALGLRSLRRHMVNAVQTATAGADNKPTKADGGQGPRALSAGFKSVDWIFAPAPQTVSGSLYGLLVGAAPFLLGAWPEDPVLRSGLACFLFAVNFLAGVAFVGLPIPLKWPTHSAGSGPGIPEEVAHPFRGKRPGHRSEATLAA